MGPSCPSGLRPAYWRRAARPSTPGDPSRDAPTCAGRRSVGVMGAVRVEGFDHLVLVCADVERTLAWYLDELGLEAVRVDEWRRREVPFPSVRVSPETIIDLIP